MTASDPSKSYRFAAIAAPMSQTIAAKLQATEDELASVRHVQATELASIRQSIAAMQAMMQSLMQTATATAQAKVASSEVQTVAGMAEVSSDGGGASDASMSISSFSNLNDNTSETSSTKTSPEESRDDINSLSLCQKCPLKMLPFMLISRC